MILILLLWAIGVPIWSFIEEDIHPWEKSMWKETKSGLRQVGRGEYDLDITKKSLLWPYYMLKNMFSIVLKAKK